MKWLCAVLLLSGAAHAEPSGHWFRDHALAEWMVGTGGWRTAIGVDTRAPGFDALSGGSEILLGVEIGAGVGVVTSGRVTAGSGYLEGLASLGVQLRVNDWVRLRAGAAAGQLTLDKQAAPLIGGFLAASIDLFALGGGRLATALCLRFDVDGLVADSATTLPDSSIALAIGLGLRY
jgi:hypothetical protein